MRGRVADLTGTRFGRLTVIRPDGQRTSNGFTWMCRCDCGTEKAVPAGSLRNGNTTSCGCFHRERVATQATRHGKYRDRIYNVWHGMRSRCSNTRHRDYGAYGGRGIKVCARWQSFDNFYADMGDPPPGTSLDRIDVDGNYEPSNCRWASASVQTNNQRRSIRIEFMGRTQTIREWASDLGINLNTLQGRYKHGDRSPRLFRAVGAAQ